ncbi:unnamed protein product [Candidula unifasciata]|uniref:G-protein coupled receptors family 1 profile domain-containing protein n=1 Tax=Candidula unifasciata TaxID=100452 RepID=A0A8S3Z7Y5_9EUPU|nr:unnamed protein product [Candidula unifasciata]
MPTINEINFKVNVTYGDTSLSDENSPEIRLFMFITWGIILPLVAVAGLVGNILTILVLWRREMHSTTILYLRGMVISDTGILIGSVITLTPLSCANYLQEEGSNYFKDVIYPVIHTPGYYIMMALQQCNVWITVSVSVERYIAICHPFRAARLITRRKTIIVLISVIIISLIYNIPHIFATRVSPCGNSHAPTAPADVKATVMINSVNILGSNATTTSARPLIMLTTTQKASPPHQCLELATTEFGQTFMYLKYRTVMYSIIIYIIPLTALVILNFFLIKELMVMQRKRSGTNIHDENEANLSLVLVLIVIVFICCQTPGLVSQFDLIPVDIFIYYLTFSNLLFTLNSAVNFLIYTAFGRKFRRVLLRVFRHICSKSRRPSQASFRMTQYTDADFDTCEPTETQCSALRGMSCYKKAADDADEKAERLPLNTVTTTLQSSSINGALRSNNRTVESDPASLTDDSGVKNPNSFETMETTAILTNSKRDLDMCREGRNGNSCSVSQEINSSELEGPSTQANSQDNFYC